MLARFHEKIEPCSTTGCHLWTGGQGRKGYGLFWFNGRMVQAHRFAYEEQAGEIPEGQVIDHLCRTPACVNPDHMEVVTQRENVRRGLAGGQHKTHCKRGHPLKGANLYVRPNGVRECNTCRRAYQRRAYHRNS